MASERLTRRGDPDTEAVLVEAAIRIVAEEGPAALSVRHVALEAGTDHDAVERAFGSKQGLLVTMLEELGRRIAAEVGAEVRVGRGTTLDLTAQVLLCAVFDGLDVTSVAHAHPVVDRLVAIGRDPFGLDERSARLAGAQVMSLFLGWQVFGDFVCSAAGLQAESPDELARLLRRAARHLLGTARRQQGVAPEP